MSAGPGTAVAVRPRRAVIDHAWRAIGPGVEVLSADDGGPLTRTVKRIIDPLVLRLRSNTRFSVPFVSVDVAVQMHDVIVGQTATLQATAQWFDLLKRERRRLRITTGNAQELYFPVCYELALLEGPPAQQDRAAAERHLRAIHADRDRTAIELLNRYEGTALGTALYATQFWKCQDDRYNAVVELLLEAGAEIKPWHLTMGNEAVTELVKSYAE